MLTITPIYVIVNHAELNRNLNLRFRRDEIYCYTGPTLVAINPFKELPIWTDERMNQYRGISRDVNPPHPYVPLVCALGASPFL